MSEKCPFCGGKLESVFGWDELFTWCLRKSCVAYKSSVRLDTWQAIRALKAEAAKAKPAQTARYWIQKNEDLKAENERLRDALAFYAKKKNHFTTSEGFAAQYDPEPSAIDKDRGEKARQALEGSEG